MNRIWLSIGALLGMIVVGALYGAYRHGLAVSDLAWEAKWERETGKRASATADALAAYRNEEQRRLSAANQVANHAKTLQASAVDDGVAADAVGDRMRSSATELANSADSCPGHTAAASRGTAANPAAMVLSDMLGRADARAGELAKAYDAARIAGLACERTYRDLLGEAEQEGPTER